MRLVKCIFLAVGIFALALLAIRLWLDPRASSWQPQSATAAANTQIINFKTALEAFKVDNGYYPTNKNALYDLLQQPLGATNWHGPYLDTIPKDPWGHDYIYECPGKHNTNSFDLISSGPDGRLGTDDDIHN